MTETLLHVEDLQVEFRTDDGIVKAVNGVTFGLAPGETLGIVGESGSGKTVTNLAMMGLVPQPPGRVVGGKAYYRGQNLLALKQRELADIRGHHIAMIFQDPMTALNPFLTIEEQMTEVTRRHLGYTHRQAFAQAVEMLERVGIPSAPHRIRDFPHQFSGGMRQRVMIAMALSCQPDVLIADEPTTALDVTIQAQILELMQDLARQEGTAIILIAHDLGVIASICQRVLVMYAGKIVEEADVDALFHQPQHPYTRGLLDSVPRLDEVQRETLVAIEGQPPDLADLPAGCSFYPRCPCRVEQCRTAEPPLIATPSGSVAACFVSAGESSSKEAEDG